MTAPDEYLDAGGPPDRDRAALFDDLVTALKDMTTRFKRCMVANGTDPEYAAAATAEAEAILARIDTGDTP